MVCPVKTDTQYSYNAENGSCYYSGNSSFTSSSSAPAIFQKRGLPFFSGVITVSITIWRYYSSEWGRWLSRDPIEEQGGWNLYRMVGNDSVNLLDFIGTIPITGPDVTSCLSKLIKFSDKESRIRQYYDNIKKQYECCINGIWEPGEKVMDKFYFPCDEKQSHQVLHCITGLFMRGDGIEPGCMMLGNVLYEAWTIGKEMPGYSLNPSVFIALQLINSAKTLLGIEIRWDRNPFDYLLDTSLDIYAVTKGYSSGDIRDCIPKCCRRYSSAR